jgi:hypothetical protein
MSISKHKHVSEAIAALIAISRDAAASVSVPNLTTSWSPAV